MAEGPLSAYTAEELIRRQIAAQDAQIAALRQPAPSQGGFLSGADPVMLSLAAGLLSPTKTGGFGESIAAGLSAASGPLSDIRQQEAARADKIGALQSAQAKLAMDLYEIQTGGLRGRKMEDPSLISSRWNEQAKDLMAEANMLDETNPQEAQEKAELVAQAKYLRDLAKRASGFGSKAESQGSKAEVKAEAETEEDQGAYPRPTTKEEYDALPSGTVYIHPNTGKQKVKP